MVRKLTYSFYCRGAKAPLQGLHKVTPQFLGKVTNSVASKFVDELPLYAKGLYFTRTYK